MCVILFNFLVEYVYWYYEEEGREEDREEYK